MSLISTPADFEHLFDSTPISLWLEDYSDLKKLFDSWRNAGVTDLAAKYFADNNIERRKY